MKELRVVFMGTPSFGVPILEALVELCNVVGVVTQPDVENSNRYSPIKEIALKYNIKVVQPERIKKDFFEVIELKPDIVITCAYGQIIPKEILDYPKYGCINVHASLLPKLRGGAPIHRAIINGYSKTGITIMYMAIKMDAGDIIRQSETTIEDTDNTGILHDRLSIMGRDLIVDTLPDIVSGNIERIKQKEEEVTFAWNLKREDEKLNLERGKKEIFNRIRGLCPWPGAYCLFEGKVCKVWASRIGDNYYPAEINGQIVELYDDGIGVKVQDGEIVFTEIQLEGKRKMKVKDFLNGVQNKNDLIGRVLE